MTFTEILAAVYEETGYQTSPASAVITRIKRYVNEGLRVVLSEPGLSRLQDSDSPATFASVASQARYTVTESVNRILRVSERTNDRTLEVMSLDRYRLIDPDAANTTGTPTHIVPIGRVAVAVQPSAATELFVDSTAAGDTGTAFVEGLITGWYRRTTSATMTGATEVSVGSTITTFEQVEDFYLSANAVGTVTLWQGTAGVPPTLTTELARITIGQKRPRYYGFYLWPTPAAAVTYYVDYRRELTELVNDTDEPPIGTDAHPALVAYAVMREREHKEETERYVIAKSRYDRIVSRLKYATQTIGGEIPVSGRPRRIGHSRLGGYYPADTWS
jgi:hypothetical protein